MPPTGALPIAEETDLVRQIDAWVLRTACRALRRWLEEGLEIGYVSVNICAGDVRQDGFIGRIRAALEEARLPRRAWIWS